MMDGAEVPPGWVCATVGDIVASDGIFTDGDWVETKDQDPDGDVRLIQLADIGDGNFLDKSSRFLTSAKAHELNCTFLEKGDLLIARMPEPLGRCCIFPLDRVKKYVTVVDVCAVRLGKSPTIAKYVMYAINSPRMRTAIEELKSGSTRKRISRRNLARVEIPLAPQNEQRRIVAKIEELFSELDKSIESLKAARAKLNVYRQAVLKHAFEGKLTAQWREENKDKLETPEQLFARIKQEREARYDQQLQEWKAAVKKWEEGGKSGKRPARSRMPKPVSTMAEEEIAHLESLTSGWLWLTAESVGIVQLGRQRSPKNRSKDYPTKYIRAANITEQGLDLDDVLDMDFLPHELSAYRLEKGDLVLSEASGSAAQVGKPAIWDDQIPNCCFQNTVIRHQPYCRDYAVYLLWLYRFFYVSGKFAQVAGGVGINHLSAFKFAQIALPLCSLAEQQEIVRLLEERFAAIEQQEREIDSALNQAEMLRQSILKKAFSGQLVPQDPDDEPASILLKRIKAEKAARSQNNTRAKRRGTTATA